MTILLTTHYLEEADELAAQLAIVDRGRIVAAGTPDELKSSLEGDSLQIELADAPVDGDVRRGDRARRRAQRARARGPSPARTRARRARPRMPSLIAALNESGHAVAKLSLSRPSLDDVYLRVAGRAFARGRLRAAEEVTRMRPLRHSWHITLRYLRALIRQPAWVAITLVQPVIWLLLFGALFKSVTRIPGFEGGSYIDYLTPGVIVMTAISSAGWNGMAFIDDMDSGVMDRFLVSPVWRGALNLGSMVYSALTIAVQSLIICGLALRGRRALPQRRPRHRRPGRDRVHARRRFAALSNALALVARQRETLIGAVTFVLLPLTFLSGAFMQLSLAPGWIADVARFNPVNWAVVAARSAGAQDADWTLVLTRVGLLSALLLLATILATRAFRAYQHSI